ncbi:MAG: hypothetical protein AVDCRST_MAG17-1997, partial [uncultured Solirubrobacterales bacterium]
ERSIPSTSQRPLPTPARRSRLPTGRRRWDRRPRGGGGDRAGRDRRGRQRGACTRPDRRCHLRAALPQDRGDL